MGLYLLLWLKGLWLSFTFRRVVQGRLLSGHFGIQLEEFFHALSIIFEAATDVDVFEHFVVAIACRDWVWSSEVKH
jgi:hypothetical protein